MVDWTPIVTEMPTPTEVLSRPVRAEATPVEVAIYIASVWLAFPWTDEEKQRGRGFSADEDVGPRVVAMMRRAGWDAAYEAPPPSSAEQQSGLVFVRAPSKEPRVANAEDARRVASEVRATQAHAAVRAQVIDDPEAVYADALATITSAASHGRDFVTICLPRPGGVGLSPSKEDRRLAHESAVQLEARLEADGYKCVMEMTDMRTAYPLVRLNVSWGSLSAPMVLPPTTPTPEVDDASAVFSEDGR